MFIELLEMDIISLIALVISSLSILGYFMAVNEYYSRKAYWDYFHVHDKCRQKLKLGVQVENLSNAVILLLVFVFLYDTIEKFWTKSNKYFFIKLFCVVVVTLVLYYIILKILVWKFNLTDINERCAWKIEEYKVYVNYKTKLYFVEYSCAGIILLIGMCVGILLEKKYIFILSIFAAFILTQFLNYSNIQKLIIYTKWYEVTVIDDNYYTVIEENNGYFYLIKCTFNKEQIIIYLDEYLILKEDRLNVKTMYFNSLKKICHNRDCSGHYIMQIRKDAQSRGQ